MRGSGGVKVATKDKRDMFELGQNIFSELESSQHAVSMTQLQEEVHTGYPTIKRYVHFIKFVQSQPKVEVIETAKGTTLVRLEEDLRDNVKFARELYPEPSLGLKLLMRLLKGPVLLDSLSEEDKVIAKDQKRFKRVEIEQSQISLTALGKEIAEGSVQIYGA